MTGPTDRVVGARGNRRLAVLGDVILEVGVTGRTVHALVLAGHMEGLDVFVAGVADADIGLFVLGQRRFGQGIVQLVDRFLTDLFLLLDHRCIGLRG